MSKLQVGVLAFSAEDTRSIIMITSRGKKQWIMPKGNIKKKCGKVRSALEEAYEEAGIIGKINANRFFDIKIIKGKKKYKLRLYYFKVEKMLNKWPESEQRIRKKIAAKKAMKFIKHKGIKRCLREYLKEAA